MANTLNLGNGNWATKEDSLLAYNSENVNFKPLPFDFTRASSATVLNKDGLIETVGSGEPRIDFKDDAKGALLLEPSRSNYVENSELTNTWTYTEFGSGSAGTITTGKTDMFGGTNAVQIDFPADAENVAIRFGGTASALTSGSASLSLYIKLVESGSKDLQLRASFSGIVNVNSTEFTRVDLSGTKISAELFNLKLRPSEGTSNGGFSIIICHPQEEQGSYPTSYIPTQGGVVTRSADVCNNGGNEQVINSTEGVLYAEISALALTGVDSRISLSNKTLSNRVSFAYSPTASKAYIIVKLNSTTVINNLNVEIGNHLDTKKIAISYKSGDTKVYLNGSELLTSSVSFTGGVLNDLSFESANGSVKFYGNTKDVRVYNTALTDAELQALTSN